MENLLNSFGNLCLMFAFNHNLELVRNFSFPVVFTIVSL